MPLDGISPVTLVFPLINWALRTVETAYELSSVPAETTDLLGTIATVIAGIRSARRLRDSLASSLNETQRNRVDDAIKKIVKSLAGIESLVEGARVDMELSPGKVKGKSRIMWVMRDKNKVQGALMRLIVDNSELRDLTSKMEDKLGTWDCEDKDKEARLGRWAPDDDSGPPPPSYQQATKDAMHQRRQSLKYRSKRGVVESSSPSSEGSIQEPSESDMTASLTNFAQYVRDNEEILASLAPTTLNRSRETFLDATLQAPQLPVATGSTIFELEGSTPGTSTHVTIEVPAEPRGVADAGDSVRRRGTHPPFQAYVMNLPVTQNIPEAVMQPESIRPLYPVSPLDVWGLRHIESGAARDLVPQIQIKRPPSSSSVNDSEVLAKQHSAAHANVLPVLRPAARPYAMSSDDIREATTQVTPFSNQVVAERNDSIVHDRYNPELDREAHVPGSFPQDRKISFRKKHPTAPSSYHTGRSRSSIKESQTVLYGSRTATPLRWREPAEDEATLTQETSQQHDVEGQGTVSIDESDVRAPSTQPGQGGRRRRLQKNKSDTQPPSVTPVIRVQSRQSRAAWQLQQQDAEVKALESP